MASILSAAFSTLTFAFFTFYLSADSPRVRRWIAQLVPQRQQEVFGLMWELAVRKTGGYVTARLVLAAICGSLSALFMLIIGMPYWLALGIWTGVVAQFVPTVGTYIAIALPDGASITSADVHALRAAAAPFVAELARRGLTAPAGATLEES